MATLPMPAPAEPTPEAEQAIVSLVRSCLTDDKTGRRAEVRVAWKQRAFEQGNQQIYYDGQSHAYMDIRASGKKMPLFMSVYNIWTPHARSFRSILSQNPPGTNFLPEDLQRATDVTAATFAEKMRHRVDRLLSMKDKQGEIAGFFITDGRTITRVYEDADGALRLDVGGVLEWKVPLYSGASMSDWGYAIHSREMSKWKARDEYPKLVDKDSGDWVAEVSSERMARLNILANEKGVRGYADALRDVVTRHTAWVRPWMYARGEQKSAEELRALYPQGLRATVIGGKLVESIAETMDDSLRVGWPSSGLAVSRPSLLHDLTNIQEDYNDYMNMLRYHVEFSMPGTWIADTLIDEEALAEQMSAPGEYHLVTVPSGADIRSLILPEEVAQIPPEIVSNLDRLLSLAQFTTGDLPSLSGEGDPHSETATGQKMLSDQAKGQLSPAWQGLQQLMAQTYELAVKKEAARSGQNPVTVSGPGGSRQQFSPQSILDGRWGCYPDMDSSYPETMADKRGAFNAEAEKLAALGAPGQAILMQPDNLKLGAQLNSLADFIIPGAQARDKQNREIDQLLQEAPVPDDTQMAAYQQAAMQAQQAGQPLPPPPMKSSVDVGKRDYHQAELDKIVEWLSSDACHEEQTKGNTTGIQNVELHADQHEAALAKIAQANAPKPEPPKLSGTFAITDPVAITQLLGEANIQTTPENIQAADANVQQEVQSKTTLNVAKTQHAAAQAQHASVLAARDEVTPIDRSPTPDELNGKEK